MTRLAYSGCFFILSYQHLIDTKSSGIAKDIEGAEYNKTFGGIYTNVVSQSLEILLFLFELFLILLSASLSIPTIVGS